MDNKFCKNDSILEGIDFNELIITLQSNEQEINKETVERVFNDILKQKLEDARYILENHINDIIEHC